MLRIIHTGRAYEVLDRVPTIYSRPSQERELRKLRAKYGALMYAFEVLNARHAVLGLRYRQQQQQSEVLEKACRSVGHLKELLEDTEQKLRATELRLKSCQKNTFNTHVTQDPH